MHHKAHSQRTKEEAKIKIPFDDCCFFFDDLLSFRLQYERAFRLRTFLESMFWTANPAVDYVPFWRVCSGQRTLR